MKIKVRVWHKKLNEYVKPRRYLVIDEFGELFSAECVIEQFTGLKDKNGKDIYEGDIIKNQSGRTARVNWHLFSGSWDAEPVYCGGDPEGLQTNLWRRYAEVIGNIHENPELME